MLIYFVAIPIALFVVVLFAFIIIRRKKRNSSSAVLQSVMKASSGSGKKAEAFYQKVYLKIDRIPIVNRYLRKVRRRIELVNPNDEYAIRKDSAKITLRAIIITLIAALVLVWINRENTFLMLVSLLGVLIVIENLTMQMINKVEDRLLKQELEFFSEVRHAFHETSMVEEAIYDASLIEEQEIVSQANLIYDVLTSADPEIELEKYYDIAPNRFLKIFAGVSYLTKEFGDRKINGISLYLKNMNNITQELQLEILKRDKLDYLFQSLTYIALAPILCIHPLKNWALDSFASTSTFYNGKWGYVAEIALMVLIFLCYALLIRIKDNQEKIRIYSSNEAWQEKVYRLPYVEKIIDGLVPNPDKPSYLKVTRLLTATASTLKVEWLYVNKAICAVVGFAVAIFMISQMHSMAIEAVLYGDTVEGTTMGKMSEEDIIEAKSMTASDRFFINKLLDDGIIVDAVRNKPKEEAVELIQYQMWTLNIMPLSDAKAGELTDMVWEQMSKSHKATDTARKASIEDAILMSGIEMPRDEFVTELSSRLISSVREDGRTQILRDDVFKAIKEIYSVQLSAEQVATNAERIYEKLVTLTSEYFKWTELVIAILVALVSYQLPGIFLSFQRKMRQLEMDNEVMQFQTIILMLMYIERVSVEYILEWLARFANIFKEPLQRCLNNYESGAFEALEQLKDEVTFKPFIRIVESLQTAVENVKITDAFDELETERAFFQEKRKEANERLINKKAKIGKVLGFAPMVVLFVGYLIIPLMWSSISDMGVYFTQMGSMI